MPEEQKDAKTEAAEPSTATVAPSTDTEKASTTAQPANKEPTLREVAQEAFDKSTARIDEETDGGEASESGVREADKTEESETATTTEEPSSQDKADNEPPPFHEHPRWKEMVSQRDEARTKAEAADKRVKDLETPATKWQNHENFLRRFNIPEQDFFRAMDVLALSRSDPLQARELLKPIWDRLSEYDPDRLPADLQQRVDAEEITEKVAREMNELRIRANGGKVREQWNQNQQATMARQTLNDAAASWDMARRGTDPDYKPKSDANEPPGLWEVTSAFFQREWIAKPPKTANDVVAICESAYKEAKAMFTKRLAAGNGAAKTALSSTRSSTTKRPSVDDAKTVRETVQRVALRHGINWTPE